MQVAQEYCECGTHMSRCLCADMYARECMRAGVCACVRACAPARPHEKERHNESMQGYFTGQWRMRMDRSLRTHALPQERVLFREGSTVFVSAWT